MLAQEMHIDFDIKVQKIASNSLDIFTNEEKDWLLNLAQNRFLKNRMSVLSNSKQQGFEATDKRLEDVEELVTDITLPTSLYDVEEKNVYAVLPYNFFALVAIKAKTNWNCNGITPIFKTATKKISVVEFKDDIISSGTFNDFKVIVSSGIIPTTRFDLNDFVPYYVPQPQSNAEKFALINLILTYFNNRNSDIRVRWENYGDRRNRNCLVFETDEPLYTSVQLQINGTNYVGSNFFKPESEVYDEVSESKKDIYKCRIINDEILYNVLKHPFAKTNYNSPVVVVKTNKIVGYYENTFTIPEFRFTYIRKPLSISLALQQHCELDNKCHSEIVDIAVQLAVAYINSDTYKNIINENLLQE